MNPLFEGIIQNGLLLDAAGVIGIGFVGLAAVRLARREKSWGGTMMAFGAIALLAARLFILLAPSLREGGFFEMIGSEMARFVMILPPIFLTLGFAGIVWGIWAHERWLRETQD
jgi:zinc transporter ZupT